MSTAAQPFCRHVNDYSALVEAVRDRTEQMEMSRMELDSVAGLTLGHSDKILRPRPEKKFGIMSLGVILDTLGLVMVLIEDPAKRDKTLARRTPFEAGNRRIGNKSYLGKQPQLENPEPAQIEAPKPRKAEPASRAHLRVIQSKSRGRQYG
jgi:hypothetical protein